MKSRALKLPSAKIWFNNLAVALLVILLGLGVALLVNRTNPVYGLAGFAGLGVLALVYLRLNVAFMILLASIFTLEFTAGSLLPYNLTVSDAIVGVMTVSAFSKFARNKTRLTFPFAIILMCFYLLMMVLSTLAAGSFSLLLPRLVQFGEFALTAFLISQLLQISIPWRGILVILNTGGCIVSLNLIYTTVWVTHFTKDISVLNTNTWGFVLDLIVPLNLAFLLMLHGSSSKSLWWLWPTSLVMCLGALATLSRGSYIGLTCGVILVVILSGPKRWLKILPVGLVLLVVIQWLVPDSATSNVTSAETFEDYRAYQWEAAFQTFLKNPFFGVGPGNFGSVPVFDRYGVSLAQPDPHNFVLRIAAETGLPGLLLIFGVIGASAYRMFKNYLSSSKSSPELSILNVGMLGGLVAYIVHSFFDVFMVRGSGMLFWIYIGLAYATLNLVRLKSCD